MGKISVCMFVFMLGCGNVHESIIKKSRAIISEEVNQTPSYLFNSLIISPVSCGEIFMQQNYQSLYVSIIDKMRIVNFFYRIKKYDFLFSILTNTKNQENFRTFSFHLLAEGKDNRIFKPEIENYISQQIVGNNIRNLTDNNVEFYSHLPFTNKLVVTAVKKIFLQSTNYIECYAAFDYLNKLQLIDNRDLLLKIPDVEDPLRSMLLTKIDTSKDISLLRSVIGPAIHTPRGDQDYMVLLMLADELSISKFKYRDLFHNPSLLNNILDKQSIATTALLSDRAKGSDYEAYLSYILQSSMKKERDEFSYFPPVFRIISLEKKEPRITKVFQYLLENGDEEVIYKLLRERQLHYSEIPLAGKHLKSNNRELRLLAALRIVRASELHEKK